MKRCCENCANLKINDDLFSTNCYRKKFLIENSTFAFPCFIPLSSLCDENAYDLSKTTIERAINDWSSFRLYKINKQELFTFANNILNGTNQYASLLRIMSNNLDDIEVGSLVDFLEDKYVAHKNGIVISIDKTNNKVTLLTRRMIIIENVDIQKLKKSTILKNTNISNYIDTL